jgi:hypothetical protein
MFIIACNNYALAFSPFEKALGFGILGGLMGIGIVLFFVVLFGLLVKAFGAFGYILGMVMLFLSIYL